VQDYGRGLCVSTNTRYAVPLREIIDRLNGTPRVPAMTCVVPTAIEGAGHPEHDSGNSRKHDVMSC
jgi:hypothetical protein